ncbi:MAG: neutral/alkaline non-lysosomal ceramidase N-terminal domain-containing protein [Chloroflexota bacterium]|nr:neutral/alkaline non-lysosomal ceramidase N-terminal domain-containing protein [Chloroflexota bacterium]MDE2930019.1 neutral/alkaline non-lysosomal ceramidase N-terminal domain-containing protein [Chloroflexota bacterium]
MADVLQAGVGRATITPPLGTWLCGFGNREHGCDAILDDLYATTLVLATDETAIAIISCDVCGLPTQQVAALRALVTERTGIPAPHILINTSHTHSGPITSASDDMSEHELAYTKTLIHTIAGSVEMAQQSPEACRVSHGAGSVAANVNRRVLRDGKVATMGENLGGAIDRTLQLLRIDTVEGEPLAALVHYACHPVVLHPPSHAVSADFIGVARGLFEAATGATMLFLQGACGNINPIGQRGELDMRERLWGVGSAVGAEALEVYSLNGLHGALGESEPLNPVLGAAQETLILDLHAPNDPPPRIRTQTPALRYWTPPLVGENQVEFEVQALHIGDVALVGGAGEVFIELAQAVQERSPFAHTMYLGYTNGDVGYIPTVAAYAEGGYEVESAHFHYYLPAAVAPDSAGRVVEASISLLEGLMQTG